MSNKNTNAAGGSRGQALPVSSGALPVPQFTLITGWDTWGQSLRYQTTWKYHEVSASGPHLARGASKTRWRRRPGQSPGRRGPRSPHNIPPNTSTCDIAQAPYAVRSHSVLFRRSSPTQRKRDLNPLVHVSYLGSALGSQVFILHNFTFSREKAGEAAITDSCFSEPEAGHLWQPD